MLIFSMNVEITFILWFQIETFVDIKKFKMSHVEYDLDSSGGLMSVSIFEYLFTKKNLFFKYIFSFNRSIAVECNLKKILVGQLEKWSIFWIKCLYTNIFLY